MVLWHHRVMPISARNQLEGRVAEVTLGDIMAHVSALPILLRRQDRSPRTKGFAIYGIAKRLGRDPASVSLRD